MNLDLCLIVGPDAAEWAGRLAGIFQLVNWEFRTVPTAAAAADLVEAALVLATDSAQFDEEPLRSAVAASPPPRGPVLAALYRSDKSDQRYLTLPGDGWSEWAPSLPYRVEQARVRAALHGFAELGGPGFADELVELMLRQTPEQLNAAGAALDLDDLATARRYAHSMKSSFANFGAKRCGRIAEAMDVAARNGDTVESRGQFATLKTEFETLRGILAARSKGDNPA